jgi:hypothetical protein
MASHSEYYQKQVPFVFSKDFKNDRIELNRIVANSLSHLFAIF